MKLHFAAAAILLGASTPFTLATEGPSNAIAESSEPHTLQDGPGVVPPRGLLTDSNEASDHKEKNQLDRSLYYSSGYSNGEGRPSPSRGDDRFRSVGGSRPAQSFDGRQSAGTRPSSGESDFRGPTSGFIGLGSPPNDFDGREFQSGGRVESRSDNGRGGFSQGNLSGAVQGGRTPQGGGRGQGSFPDRFAGSFDQFGGGQGLGPSGGGGPNFFGGPPQGPEFGGPSGPGFFDGGKQDFGGVVPNFRSGVEPVFVGNGPVFHRSSGKGKGGKGNPGFGSGSGGFSGPGFFDGGKQDFDFRSGGYGHCGLRGGCGSGGFSGKGKGGKGRRN